MGAIENADGNETLKTTGLRKDSNLPFFQFRGNWHRRQELSSANVPGQ